MALTSRQPGSVRPRGGTLEIEALVGRAKGGDQAAFADLYEQTSGRIFALCLRMSGSQESAEELTQDVFVRCWQKLETFRGDSMFTTWLHRLAVNVVLQARRKRTRTEDRERGVDDLERYGHEAKNAMPETMMDLEKAIAALPAGAREVLILRDIEGYRYKDVAEIKGVAVGTVKAQVHRARKLVREAMER
ncbi:MAG: RNA polymerase sigma factor [Longimicrobiales bacterium]